MYRGRHGLERVGQRNVIDTARDDSDGALWPRGGLGQGGRRRMPTADRDPRSLRQDLPQTMAGE